MKLIGFLPLVILSLAAFRLTRLLVIDSLFQGTREKLHVWLINKNNLVTNKIYEGISCTWCVGVHVSWIIYSIYTDLYPWDFGINGWLSVGAIAGIQGMIHALEPDDDH